jgi:hypothetical protein
MPSKAFLTKRKEGEVAQTYVFTMFRRWGLSVTETPRGYHPGYDGIVEGPFYGNNVRFKIEVKYDKQSRETGNVYLDINSLRKSQASILAICLNDPIDTVLMLPLKDALDYALACPYRVKEGGEFKEPAANPPKDVFIRETKAKILSTLT